MVEKSNVALVVISLNVEEVVDGAWSANHSLLPALSSKGACPYPKNGDVFGAYRCAYQGFVSRFGKALLRIAKQRTPQAQIKLESGDLLRPWYKNPDSSWDDPLFRQALKQTQLPTRHEIESF